MLPFENRSFHQDRPQNFRLKTSEVTWFYALKIDHLIKIAPHNFRLKNLCTPSKPFSGFKNRHFASHRPPCYEMLGWKIVVRLQSSCFGLKISNFLHIVPKRWCKNKYHVNDFSDFENGQFSQHRPPIGDAKKKCYIVEDFSQFENGQVSQHRPQQSNAKCALPEENSHFHQHRPQQSNAKCGLPRQNSHFHQHRPYSLCINFQCTSTSLSSRCFTLFSNASQTISLSLLRERNPTMPCALVPRFASCALICADVCIAFMVTQP